MASIVILFGLGYAQTSADQGRKIVNIHGWAADACGDPFANGTVRLIEAGQKQAVASTKIDADGQFAFVGVPSTAYELHFEASGFEPLVMAITSPETTDINIVVGVNRIDLVLCSSSTAPVKYYRAPIPNTLSPQPPTNPSVYTGKKRRDLTLEEAYALVKAFQKDHGEDGYGLDDYKVKEYPGFQFFQAVPDPPSGHIHFPVDLRTGDVWDEASCEKLTSPSLKMLQIAMRNRVGLTPDEYRKLGRTGPFCEQ